MKFIFDLDGTLTDCETLPKISEAFGLGETISELTQQTIRGYIPFMESFIKRVDILGKLNPEEVSKSLSDVKINEDLSDFIRENISECLVATGNYRGWLEDLRKKIPCEIVCSEGIVDSSGKVRLSKILKKEEIVAHYQSLGEKVVFVGDGNNDAEAMRIADVSIACGIVHSPAPSVMQVTDYVVYESSALVRLLNQIKSPQEGTSIVISAAGVGSRLGLGQTKSLIKINGISLIQYQLEAFADFEDVRIVIGFQASDLITEVLRHRRNLIFVFNHDYFHTKTGASLFLGAQHANASIIAWDGDLLVHPDDINTCLESHDQYIGVSAKTSHDIVFAKVSGDLVTSFSRQDGDYEWSGPACILRDNIKYTTENVFNQLENLLPLPLKIIRARDVDTYEDYVDAIKFVASWPAGNGNINEYYEKLSAKITLPTETRNKSSDFSQFDIQFVKKLAKPNTSLLDLGSGTGLLINNLIDDFSEILAVEKYTGFSNFIRKCPNIQILNSDILDFEIDREFDVITIFGVMNFFNKSEAKKIYSKCRRWIKPDGRLVVKHQMGKTEDVVVNGYSEELQSKYYSEYRWVENEIKLIESCGFSVINTSDIYPDHFNRWNNTRFFAITCSV